MTVTGPFVVLFVSRIMLSTCARHVSVKKCFGSKLNLYLLQNPDVSEFIPLFTVHRDIGSKQT